MFPTSSQARYWMFGSEEELKQLRSKASSEYVQNCRKKGNPNISTEDTYNYFLTPDEERLMVKRFELHMRDFCKRFQPPMPRCVMGTSIHYFKRFYIKNSVMNYHPKEIMVTCVYLACKVEEFNVSLLQFVANIKGDREKAMDIILNNELLLMEQLNFHLAVHNPFRAVEGLLIDIKTRGSLHDPERLRSGTEHFLDRAYLTDAILLYAPSQVALAAILHAASKLQENLDSYVTEILFGKEGRDNLEVLVDAVRAIRSMEKTADVVPDKVVIKNIDKKLERCRNPENNPDSDIYKKKMQAMLDEDDDLYYSISNESQQRDESTLKMTVPGSSI